MLSRKRKLENGLEPLENARRRSNDIALEQGKLACNDNSISKSFQGVLLLLAKLKSVQDSRTSISERLDLIRARNFLRQDEWTISYLCEALAKESSLSSQDAVDAWLALVPLLLHVSRDLLPGLLYNVDVAALMRKFLCMNHEHDISHVLRSMTELLRDLTSDRRISRLLTRNLEQPCAALVACFNLAHQDEHAQADMGAVLVDLIILSASRPALTPRFVPTVRNVILPNLVAYLDHHEASADIHHLLEVSIFSEIDDASLSEFFGALKGCQQGVGFVRLCQISFNCAKAVRKSSSKVFELRNALLKYWIAAFEAAQLPKLFFIYWNSSTDSKITRPLSTDENLTESLKAVVTRALTPATASSDLISAILKIDLDVLVPNHESAVWSLIERTRDSRLLLAWLKVFIEIRSMAAFLRFLVGLESLQDGILNKEISNLIARTVASQTPSVQAEFMAIVMQSSTPLKTSLLVAIIGGFPKDSPILTDQMSNLEDLSAKDPALSRILFFKLTAKALLPASILKLINSMSIGDSREAAETWLRSKELQHLIHDNDIDVAHIEECLEIAATDSDFLRSLVGKWIPTISRFMTMTQVNRLVDMVYTASNTKNSLIAHPSLLECQKLHSALQHRLQPDESDMKRSLQMMILIPIKYFHSAFRRSMLQCLLQSDDESLLKYDMLLKLARADVLPTFASSQQYVEFATRSLMHDFAKQCFTSSSMSVLRQMYSKSFTLGFCWEVVTNINCHPLIKAEMFKYGLLKETSAIAAYTNLVKEVISQIARAKALNPKDCALLMVVLDFLRLQDQEYQLPKSEVLDSGHLGSLDECRLHAQDNGSPELVGMLLEVAAWHAKSSDDAARIIQEEHNLGPVPEEVLLALATSLSASDLEEFLLNPKFDVLKITATSKARLLQVLISSGSQKVLSNASWIQHLSITTLAKTEQLNSIDAEFGSVVLDLCQALLAIHSRSTNAFIINHIFTTLISCLGIACADMSFIYVKMHRVLQSMFLHHAHLLHDRYQFVVYTFRSLLLHPCESASGMQKETAESLTRLFGTFVTASRKNAGTTPDIFNKAFAKHLPPLLTDYIRFFTRAPSNQSLSAAVKKILSENLVYEVMSICGPHEREAVANTLDAAGKVIFKKFREDWVQFGTWSQK